MIPHLAWVPVWALALGTALAGCQAKSHRFHFKPSPLEVLVQPDAGGEVLARVLVSVPESVRGGGPDRDWPEMSVRLRIENRTTSIIAFDARSALLVGSDLRAFGPARCDAGGMIAVPAGSTTLIELFFPFPERMPIDAPGLEGLNLQWVLLRGGDAFETSVTVDRAMWVRDPDGYGSVFIGVGC